MPSTLSTILTAIVTATLITASHPLAWSKAYSETTLIIHCPTSERQILNPLLALSLYFSFANDGAVDWDALGEMKDHSINLARGHRWIIAWLAVKTHPQNNSHGKINRRYNEYVKYEHVSALYCGNKIWVKIDIRFSIFCDKRKRNDKPLAYSIRTRDRRRNLHPRLFAWHTIEIQRSSRIVIRASQRLDDSKSMRQRESLTNIFWGRR